MPADPSSPIPAALTQLAHARPLHDGEPPHLLVYLASVPTRALPVAAAIGAWLADRDRSLGRDRGRPATRRRAVAVDGKTLRGTRPAGSGGRPVHLLAAMDHQRHAVLAQRQVGGAPEEVPAFAPLLADLDLAGVVVHADALQTDPEAAEFLVTRKQAH